MKRKPSSRRNAGTSPEQGVWVQLPLRQIGLVAGVLILVGAVLFLKLRQSPSASAEPTPGDATVQAEPAGPTSSDTEDSTSLVAATPVAMNTTAPSLTPNLLPEAQLDRLLRAGEPMFLFFHSNTCAQCVKMTGIVEEVYPDFSDSVALVDVNVYDQRNKSLLQRANIRAIPTLIFVDREGEVGGYVGVMEPDALREQLRKLGEE